ncbi:phospholipase C, phosphocholine-specific [Chryseobacterium sp. SNU WT5]|uniref:phosphocholine-specific phospholipase C n=1 Tax=Chryseobacterium sp. SNU WT5 TaxID=2594269 RepID=UPI00117E4960|nr:phospholipase C, phosphocholine-specific [Chryseobacterium sp. SNU WT5]QDP85706.1 phospholipase C, phosphocholine-specific [Chryseobacterium sp. SNU WT5]
MDRKTFLEKSAMLMAGLGTAGVLHPSILNAFKIEPAGNSFYDAEHVVILTQENRSFDHAFGSMKGVRGFLDQRAFIKPDGKSVFFQQKKGKYAIPTRLDIKNTKATWMSALPHSWRDQIEAFNGGKYDQWIEAKASGRKEYAEMPLTMGYYTREDLPFYYQLADAFTIADHYFCSSLTGTTPNRLFHWSGTIRKSKEGSVKANVYNGHINYDKQNQATWETFPELLEKNEVSWKIYQNDISLPKGMTGEQDAWLSNFTDNPLEWFVQYRVRFSPGYYHYIPSLIQQFEKELAENPKKAVQLNAIIDDLKKDIENYKPEDFNNLNSFEQNIHQKAFSTNINDPDFWKLDESTDSNGNRLVVPKGDVLYQFRKDTEEGTLPLVSWVIAPERFSDHPGSPWYGAWFISEMMNILTKDPEVWKKTIFIINYDENDGYFDHVIPFTPPNNPSQPVDYNGESGAEFIHNSQKYMQTDGLQEKDLVEGPIGLGYRVPLIVASPWTRGGYVNSEVFDHTSVIQFLEKFIEKKFKKDVRIDNISDWRRAICGDLTSIFNHSGEKSPVIDFVDQRHCASQINAAKDKPVPDFKYFNKEEIAGDLLEIQERGIKKSNSLPYNFLVNLTESGIVMENTIKKGVPLQVFDRSKLKEAVGFYFPYALFGKQKLTHSIVGACDYEVFGPNGFYRSFEGEFEDIKKRLQVKLLTDEERKVFLVFSLKGSKDQKIEIHDHYTGGKQEILVSKNEKVIRIETPEQSGWYDLEIKTQDFRWRFAGRGENGKESISDPHWA